MILADWNGGAPSIFNLAAAPDNRWDIDYSSFKSIRMTDFEAVDESSLMINKDSGQARITSASMPTQAQSAQPDAGIPLMAILVVCIGTIAIGCVVVLLRRFQIRKQNLPPF